MYANAAKPNRTTGAEFRAISVIIKNVLILTLSRNYC